MLFISTFFLALVAFILPLASSASSPESSFSNLLHRSHARHHARLLEREEFLGTLPLANVERRKVFRRRDTCGGSLVASSSASSSSSSSGSPAAASITTSIGSPAISEGYAEATPTIVPTLPSSLLVGIITVSDDPDSSATTTSISTTPTTPTSTPSSSSSILESDDGILTVYTTHWNTVYVTETGTPPASSASSTSASTIALDNIVILSSYPATLPTSSSSTPASSPSSQ